MTRADRSQGRIRLLARCLAAALPLATGAMAQERSRADPFLRDRSLAVYEPALVTALDAFRSGGRQRLESEVDACYARIQRAGASANRVQFCYLLGDAAVVTLLRSGDTQQLAPVLYEPARRQRTLPFLMRYGLDARAADGLLTDWGTAGRQAVGDHEAELVALKAAQPAAARPGGK